MIQGLFSHQLSTRARAAARVDCTVARMQCPRGHGECQMGYSRPSQRPYWECTQCNFSQWLVLGEGQASLRRSSSNKPGRARSTRKFVTEAAAFDAVATQLAGGGAPPLQLNCTASWDYTTALATAAAAAEHQEMFIQLKQDLGIRWYPRSQPSLPVYPLVASTSRYAGSWSN